MTLLDILPQAHRFIAKPNKKRERRRKFSHKLN